MAAGERLFEALTEPEREAEYPLGEIALALRLECWDHAFAIGEVQKLALRLGTERAISGYVDRLTRARMMGIAHLILLQVAPYEDEFRRWLASKNANRGRLA